MICALLTVCSGDIFRKTVFVHVESSEAASYSMETDSFQKLTKGREVFSNFHCEFSNWHIFSEMVHMLQTDCWIPLLNQIQNSSSAHVNYRRDCIEACDNRFFFDPSSFSISPPLTCESWRCSAWWLRGIRSPSVSLMNQFFILGSLCLESYLALGNKLNVTSSFNLWCAWAAGPMVHIT